MSSRLFSRSVAAALIAIAGVAMVATSFDADARRMGGGGSFGRQSGNVTMQRQAVTPPSAAPGSTAGAAAAPAAAGAASAATGSAARTGASRWLGPIAGIAAGLGIAALLSHLGLSGAFAEILSSMLLIALLAFAVLFIIRRLRGAAAPRQAMQGAYGMSHAETRSTPLPPSPPPSILQGSPSGSGTLPPSTAITATPRVPDAQGTWVIPGDFDTANFLRQAKEQFVRIQGIWDSGDTDRLHEYLTDDLITELKPQLAERQGSPNQTEVVLLNAEMLGIEAVSDGHLASVRFSGMLREAPGTEAFRFEEVWNLFKPAQGGWLLAGIQQIPVEYTH